MLKLMIYVTSSPVSEGVLSFLASEPGVELSAIVYDERASEADLATLFEPVPAQTLRVKGAELYLPETLATLAELEIDLGITAWWNAILKAPALDIPKRGTLNFHPSLLPYNRGKHTTFWTLVEETPFGVTLHAIDERIDAGKVFCQQRLEKDWTDTGETLHRRSQEAIVALFKENFSAIASGEIQARDVDYTGARVHFSKEITAASEIDLEKSYSGRELLNLIRARTYPPYPGAWFVDEGETYEVRVSITKKPKV